jgi:hypothetical protein
MNNYVYSPEDKNVKTRKTHDFGSKQTTIAVSAYINNNGTRKSAEE